MIVNSGHDENGKLYGGTLGDQTGGECVYREWYSCPWNRVFRHPNQRIAATIAAEALQAAGNDHVGYDQSRRETFWEQLEACGTYCAKDITVDCAMDCSAGIAAYIRAAGYLCGDDGCKSVAPDTYTGNERERLLAAGFTELTEGGYLWGDEYLLPGDILLRDNYHTACNVSVGEYAPDWDPDAATVVEQDNFGGVAGAYRCVCSDLNVRDAPWGDLAYASDGTRIHYVEGEEVILCDWSEDNGGVVWGRYQSFSGATRYVAIRRSDGSEVFLQRV